MKNRYFIPFITFFILILIISRVRKIKREDKAIAIALRECDGAMLFLGGIGILLLRV
ncbi:hypothetical protein OW763_14250 [Clostridium aestuarii]|uniref:Uncharacterized protein n=1 Tax=Clostridium aestuarii TaxID=338193 RepID=A0ABT4D2M1_9CLOT|nr:hypothetical protein [Clostridium aestuarii]MCY6485492.1 hypothetical protein [Clostridium aestuarii]